MSKTAVKIFTTGELARQLGCSVDSIRRYERIGVIVAQRTESGRMIFNEHAVTAASAYRQKIGSARV